MTKILENFSLLDCEFCWKACAEADSHDEESCSTEIRSSWIIFAMCFLFWKIIETLDLCCRPTSCSKPTFMRCST